METWDICSLEVAPHHPQVLRSDDETRAIAIHLPGGEELQEHQVHERTYLLVASGEVEIGSRRHQGQRRSRFSRALRAQREAHGERRHRRKDRARASAMAG